MNYRPGEKEHIESTIKKLVKKSSVLYLDELISKGWMVFPNKRIEGNGYIVENLKNGEEFGTILGQHIAREILELLDSMVV